MPPSPKTDVAIIGAGPIGLFGIFVCGMLGLRAQVFDALPERGGQLTALYPEKPIYDIPGMPSILAGDLVTALERQAAPFAPVYHMNSPLCSVNQNADQTWTLENSNGVVITSQTILIAGGAGAFGPNRPPLANLEAFEGRSVFFAVRHPDEWANKTIAIAGGGDSAIDWANILAPKAKHLYLIHRRNEFRAAPASLKTLDSLVTAGQITKKIPYQLSDLHGKDGQINSLTLRDLDDHVTDIPADVLFCFFGLTAKPSIWRDVGLTLDGPHIIIDPTTGATNKSGIFAAGDGVTYAHKQRLILTGFAEVSQAAQAIDAYLNPGRLRHHEHSTTKGIPKG